MNLYAKISRMREHLETNPTDYQTKISLLKARSDLIEHERRNRPIAKLKKIAEYRKLLGGNHEE